MNQLEIWLYWATSTLVAVLATHLVGSIRNRRKLGTQKKLSESIKEAEIRFELLESKVSEATERHETIDLETKELQALKIDADGLRERVVTDQAKLDDLLNKINANDAEFSAGSQRLQTVLSKLDLYSQLEGFTDYGHFEIPDYLYETSARFSEEIKRVREKQKELIRAKDAATCPESVSVHPDKATNKRILDGQLRLMLSAFNIECDLLIGKVRPSNFARTLERISAFAGSLEKSAASLHCGFSLDYIELKCEECRLQYQFTLKKQEEQEEQRLIREQIREEQRAVKEYERAIAEAEKEERMYREMLGRARKELLQSSDEDRLLAEQKISDLERKLEEAETKEEALKGVRFKHLYFKGIWSGLKGRCRANTDLNFPVRVTT